MHGTIGISLSTEERAALVQISITSVDADYLPQRPLARLRKLDLVREVGGFLALTALGELTLSGPRNRRWPESMTAQPRPGHVL